MGNATSSALRADDPVTPAPAPGDDGPAFGSLANLGGPRKFKKKPVLVLDPEELEKAHMMFQEASAEMLGEEVERPERGATLLGLAPMDDDEAAPEDMGAPDDTEAGEDDETIPSAEEVLRMTTPRLPLDPAMGDTEDDFIAQQLENLDVDHRIFPSLPLKSEEEIAAEEEAERAAIAAQAALDRVEEQAADEPVSATDSVPELNYEPPAPPASPRVHAFPVNPLPEPEAELEPLPEIEPEPEPEPQPLVEDQAASVFGEDPFLDFPKEPLHFAFDEDAGTEAKEPQEPDPEPDAAFEAEAIPEVEPEPEQENEPAFELELDDTYDWEDETPLGLAPEEEFEGEDELADEAASEAQGDGSYTEIDDEPVDGYAFMYAHNPRARTLHALAEGESNSLRAKLLKEREEAMAEMGLEEFQPSVWARFTAWLRGLFG